MRVAEALPSLLKNKGTVGLTYAMVKPMVKLDCRGSPISIEK
jgi:hypothetical protein